MGFVDISHKNADKKIINFLYFVLKARNKNIITKIPGISKNAVIILEITNI